MSQVPDAWDDEWSTAADVPQIAEASDTKKPSNKQTKAQRRAQQAEFNRQLWAEAEGPKQTNFFLESRNVVPLRQDYKPPPVLLSRKGPIIQRPRPPTDAVSSLNIRDQSSEDEEDAATRKQTLEQRQAQAAKEREEKQRKYEERRQELFGASQSTAVQGNKSGTSSPASLTPPGSRSSTPNRGGKRGRRGNSQAASNQPRATQRELFDHSYSPRPEAMVAKRNQLENTNGILPIREPKGPDGSGRGGAGFTNRERRSIQTTDNPSSAVQTA